MTPLNFILAGGVPPLWDIGIFDPGFTDERRGPLP